MRVDFFLLVMALFLLPVRGSADTPEKAVLDLRFIESFKIADKKHGFVEPSGLSLSHSGDSFWSVSDDTKAIFNLGLDGKVRKSASFPLDVNDLEGIILDPSGELLYAVQEKNNQIIKIDVADRNMLVRRALADMEGYDAIAPLLANSSRNKGLEGITLDPEDGTIYVIVESEPRLLVLVSPDLQAITGHRVLSAESGFVDDVENDRGLDISGLAYDQRDGRIWIVSEKGARVFRYDLASNRAQSAPLLIPDGDDIKRLKGAEGVAFDARTHRLYILTDKDKRSRLYVFEVRPEG